MDKLKIKIEAIFVLMVLLVSTIVVPVSAAKDSGAYWCDTYTGGVCDEGAFPEGFVELTGAEKNKAVAQANKDEDVKVLKKEIKADGYTPMGNAGLAWTMDVNGTEVLIVTFSFKPKNGNGNETAEITYLYNAETGDSVVMRTASWKCLDEGLTCIALIIGAGGATLSCAPACVTLVACLPCIMIAVSGGVLAGLACDHYLCCEGHASYCVPGDSPDNY